MQGRLGFARDTLAEARERVRNQLSSGVTCPCCDQIARVDERKLHSSMAATLCRMVQRAERGDWIEMGSEAPLFVLRAKDFPLLRHWGLIVEKTTASGRKSGLWAPTAIGCAFARGEVRVPRAVLTFNGKSHGLTGDLVDIHEALGSAFNYQELMGRARE